MSNSQDTKEIRLVLQGIHFRPDKDFSEMIFQNLERYADLSLTENSSYSLVNSAVDLLTYPYREGHFVKATSGGDILKRLLNHSRAEVRLASSYVVSWGGFDEKFRSQKIRGLLQDPEASVRRGFLGAMHMLEMRMNIYPFVSFIESRIKMEADPIVRNEAEQLLAWLQKNKIKNCQRSLRDRKF